jgi:hypothetical protein
MRIALLYFASLHRPDRLMDGRRTFRRGAATQFEATTDYITCLLYVGCDDAPSERYGRIEFSFITGRDGRAL